MVINLMRRRLRLLPPRALSTHHPLTFATNRTYPPLRLLLILALAGLCPPVSQLLAHFAPPVPPAPSPADARIAPAEVGLGGQLTGTTADSSALRRTVGLAQPLGREAPVAPPGSLTFAASSHPPNLEGTVRVPLGSRCRDFPGRGRALDGVLERESILMGTRLRAAVVARDRQAEILAIEAAFDEVARLEAVLSSWRDDSELGRLNAAPVGRSVRLSEELAAVLMEARAWTTRSRGAFDPVVGSFIDAWDLRGAGRRPSPEELAAAEAAAGWGALRVHGSTRWARRHTAAWVTSGAFGKGIALRAAARRLGEATVESALLDFGGQLAAIAADGCASWTVGVAHPARREAPVALLRLRGGHSLATSGSSERFVEVGGERYGHIVDPRSGRPVEAWGSITVLAQDPLVADVAATAAYVLGPEEGLAWVGSQEGLSALALRVREDGRLEARWSESLCPWIIEMDARWIVSAGPETDGVRRAGVAAGSGPAGPACGHNGADGPLSRPASR